MAFPTNFIVADDHPLFRVALGQVLQLSYPEATVHFATDMYTLQESAEQYTDADLVLLDLHMPGSHGFSGLIYIKNQYPQLPVVLISANDRPEIAAKSIEYGAAGFLPKSSSPEIISAAIDEVLKGNIYYPPDYKPNQFPDKNRSITEAIGTLTPQQFRVATMLTEGLLNKQIAYEMNVTEATIKAHITAIFRKLGVSSRTQAVLLISSLDVDPPAEV